MIHNYGFLSLPATLTKDDTDLILSFNATIAIPNNIYLIHYLDFSFFHPVTGLVNIVQLPMSPLKENGLRLHETKVSISALNQLSASFAQFIVQPSGLRTLKYPLSQFPETHYFSDVLNIPLGSCGIRLVIPTKKDIFYKFFS